MGIKLKRQEEKFKIIVMAILLAGACFLTYYFHAILETGRIFTHFFYIPIVLASIWWRRKGLVVAIFLATLLSLSHTFIRIAPLTANDYLRALMFIAIAFVVSILSERIAKAQEKSTHLNAILDAIRKVNQLIIKEKDWDRLLQGVCDTLIQTRGYHNAWIALFDESRRLVTMAEAGLGEDFLPMVDLLKRGELPDCGLRALKQSDVVAIEDPSSTCANCPLSGKYSGSGAITARVEHNGKLYGLLTVSIPRDLVANEEEQILLKDVADDIALALHSIELSKESKQAEVALRESEERYRNLANSLPQIVFETDERGTLTFTNHNAFDLFGYTEDDFGKGLNALQMLIPGDQDRAMDNILKVLSGERLGGIEYTAMKKDGSTFPVVIHSNPIVREDKPVGLRGIIIDLTDRKRAEEEKRKLESQLLQAQKMEAIGTLAGGIAHDFNNILGAIIGYTEIASLQVSEDNEAKASLKEVLKAGNRAKDLVKQILAFSRKGEQERIPVQISLIVKEALKLLRSTLPTTIEIRQNIESDTGIVEVDPTQIHQILMNLCTNAGHAMREEGGVLEVGIRDVEVGSWDSELGYLDMTPGPYLLLTVSDTGEGMTPEMLGRIFDPYFTTKEKGVGTGLGLAVVDGIVKSHGGTVRAYSEPGKGTTFHVYLPRIKEAKEMAEDDSRPGVIPTGQERVLFVDDEPVLVDIGKQMLERLGYEVTTRTSSIEALELFRIKPDQFDLVITDMTMPQMTGDRLARELMKIRPDIPVIICTGYSERISEEKAKGMGIKSFVMKPIVIRDLANTVRKALD